MIKITVRLEHTISSCIYLTRPGEIMYVLSMKKLFAGLVTLVAFVMCLSTVLADGPFVDVSNQVGFIQELKKSKAAPVWGDFNNDGVLDLIVSCHGLSVSHGPFVYLGHANGTFTDIR